MVRRLEHAAHHVGLEILLELLQQHGFLPFLSGTEEAHRPSILLQKERHAERHQMPPAANHKAEHHIALHIVDTHCISLKTAISHGHPRPTSGKAKVDRLALARDKGKAVCRNAQEAVDSPGIGRRHVLHQRFAEHRRDIRRVTPTGIAHRPVQAERLPINFPFRVPVCLGFRKLFRALADGGKISGTLTVHHEIPIMRHVLVAAHQHHVASAGDA